ncbi:hemopexin repeat-containing protein [Chitinimonas viridis]|uniref:Hemopexin repeat-containing protein n=1 Tax=Chitinimonas viridis TaxID=664880 RepID=A0ABT8B4H3_9NEIS|nr:hemopexin repeat-containing protein [Chitinimonas viridis]MDN3577147.1 hemopexin repeat-containing protein [Chitinimonas viridis]
MHRKQFTQRLLLAGLVGLSLASQAAPKAVLIGMDGTQYEKLQALNLPHISRFYQTKAYTGGVQGSGSEQATVSGPGWTTMLTGVWANKHGVTSNESGLANAQFPSVFKRIRQAKPGAYIASITNWASINQRFLTQDVAGNNFNASGLSDQAVTDKAVEQIRNTAADFIFVALDDPDHAGHASGFGPAYNQAIRDSDARLGQIMAAVEAKRASTGDDWLVLVTTDHGREATLGYGHGNQTLSEKTIFIASNQPLNAEFSQPVGNVSNQGFSGLYGYAAHTSIAPTLLRHLGIEPQPQWLLDGIPLKGALGVQKLLPASTNQATLNWYSTAGGMVDIQRNGQSVATVPAAQQGWLDSAAPMGMADYNLIYNGTPAALRLNRRQIQATLDWDATRSYFFLDDGSYVRYNQVLDKADNGYPATTSDTSWPGLGSYASKLVSGFSKDAGVAYLFLNDGRYLRYNKIADKVDSGYPKAINDSTWPGLGAYATQIRATLRWSGSTVYFFLRDGRYLRYNLTLDKVDAGYPKPVTDALWPGLGAYAGQIESTMKWDDTRAYFFLSGKRYIRYNITLDRAESGYPKAVNQSTWPGLAVQ